MLKLTGIEAITRTKYLVTLERDGQPLQYEFTITFPDQDQRGGGASAPEHMYHDLLDYEPDRHYGSARGGINIPVIRIIRGLVWDVVCGDNVEFPIVLDNIVEEPLIVDDDGSG